MKKTTISKNWVYLKNDKVAAYLFGWMVEEEYHLNNIVVAKEFRNQGIGKKLMETMIDTIRNVGGNHILLEVMQENSSAILLYEKLGFKVLGDRKDYYTKGQHAVCYKLDLKNG